MNIPMDDKDRDEYQAWLEGEEVEEDDCPDCDHPASLCVCPRCPACDQTEPYCTCPDYDDDWDW